MKINELKQDKTDKVERMSNLIKISEVEKRKFNEAEEAEYVGLEIAVEDLTKEIERKEKLERHTLSAGIDRSIINPVNNANFSIAKFLREAAKGQLSGTELSMSQNARQTFTQNGQSISGFALPMSIFNSRGVTTGSETNLEFVSQLPELQIIKTPAVELLSKMGVRVFDNLVGGFDIPYNKQMVANFVGENAALTGETLANTGKATMKPRRLTLALQLSLEYLNQISPAVDFALKKDMVDAIYRGILIDLFKSVTGHTYASNITTGVTTHTWSNVIGLQGKLDIAGLSNLTYVSDYTQMSTLKTTIKSGSTFAFIAENAGMNNLNIGGFPYLTTALAPSKSLILGDFGYSAVGIWQSLDVLVDMYGDNAKQGAVTVYVTGLVDTAVTNPYAFAINELA